MEFMGISIGILALICTAMLLFGRTGTVKMLAWLAVLAVLGIGGTVGFIVWRDQVARRAELPAGYVLDKHDPVVAAPQPDVKNLSDAELLRLACDGGRGNADTCAALKSGRAAVGATPSPGVLSGSPGWERPCPPDKRQLAGICVDRR